MAEITIKDFKGVNLKEGLWDQGFAAFSQSMDFYGLGDDQTKVSYAGVLQGGMSTSSMSLSIGSNNLSAMNDFSWLDKNNRVYGVDVATQGRIYKWDTSNWVVDKTAAAAGWRIRNIANYNQLLYITSASGTAGTQNGALASYDGTTLTEGAFTGLYTADPMPMKVYSGYLFIANGRYVDRYDGTTYQAQKLQLPIDFTIRSMEVFRDGLYISADNGQLSRIFVWDGSSPTFNDSINLSSEQYAPTLQAAQGMLWAVGNRGGDPNDVTLFTALTPIYIFQQGQPELVFELPIKRNRAFQPVTGVAAYQNGILIGSCEGSSASYEAGVGGVWFIGKELSTGLFHASNLFAYVPAAGPNVNIGGIFSSGVTQKGTSAPAVYFSTSASNGTFSIVQLASASVSDLTGGYSPIWISLPIDAGSTKLKAWTGLRINMEHMTVAGQTVTVDYRLDSPSDVTGFTNAKTFTYSVNDSTTSPYAPRFLFIPIGRVSRTIALRIKFGTISSQATPRIHSVTLYYEPFES